MRTRTKGCRWIWGVAVAVLAAGCADSAAPDGDCSGPGCQCVRTGEVEAACADGADDDCDGLVDCADPDCERRSCVDDGNGCTEDLCSAGACGHASLPQGAVCRASAGLCDLEETCDGAGSPCPEDALAPASQVCRAATGGCDVAEVCTGAGIHCPEDVNPACTCPENGPLAGYAEHDGLRTIDSENFKLQDTGTWDAYAAIVDGLGLPAVSLETLSLNRTATKLPAKSWVGFKAGFLWEQSDLDVAYWIPQGLAGGAAGPRKLTVVSWHYQVSDTVIDPTPPADGTDKGVRISVADVTDMDAVTYRHLLLVEPDATLGFKPVKIHAGGLAWSGRYLYVADTSRGMRVFDLGRILQVPSTGCGTHCGRNGSGYCAYGYAYVVPQVGGYYLPAELSSSCRPTFSYLTLDRSTTPDSILSGEYDNDPATGIYSRILRWPIVEATDRLETAGGLATASQAWYAGNRNIQGVAVSGGKFFLSATRYVGALFTGPVGSASTVYKAADDDWAWMSEGLYVSTTGNLWVSTEGHEKLPRCVFAADVASIP